MAYCFILEIFPNISCTVKDGGMGCKKKKNRHYMERKYMSKSLGYCKAWLNWFEVQAVWIVWMEVQAFQIHSSTEDICTISLV